MRFHPIDVRLAIVAPAAVLLFLGVVAPSDGSITFYTSPSAFNSVEPGLPVETFSSANMFGQPIITHASPVSSATNDSVFAGGSILPGISVTTLNPGMTLNALEFEGSASGPKSVAANWFQDTLIFNFAPGVSAVGEDIAAGANPGSTGTLIEKLFNGSTQIGSTSFQEAPGATGFIGAVSPSANITKMTLFLDANADTALFASNIAFGSVPEPASLATLCAGMLLLLRRRDVR